MSPGTCPGWARFGVRWLGGIIERRERLLTLLVLVLVAAFVLVPLMPALLGRGLMVDVGALSAFQPFRADVGAAYSEVVTCRGDTIDYYLPGIAEIKRSLFAGHFPTWAPYEVGGAPLASLPNHGAFSPMSLPYFLLPLWLAPAYVKLLELVVAIWGMVLFLRRLGLAQVSGLVAGVVFAGSGFMLMWTNWPHTRVAALIPAIFWALERLVQEVRARDVVLVAVLLASMLLVGFPAVVLFTLTVAAPYVVMRVVTLYRARLHRMVQALTVTAGGVVLGLGLSAVQILPFAANIAAFDFANRNEIGQHLPLYTAFTVIDPFAVGSCVGGQKLSEIVPIEAVAFIGAAALPLAVAAGVLRRRSSTDAVPTAFFLAAAAILGTAMWLGGPALTALQSLPLWSTNFIGRASSVLAFLVAIAVGAGFDRLVRGGAPSSGDAQRHARLDTRAQVKLVVAAALCVGVGAAVTVAIRQAARDQGFEDHVAATAGIPALLLVGGTAAVFVAARGSEIARNWSVVILVVLIVAQSTHFAHTLLPTSRRQDFYPDTATHRYLADHLGGERYGASGWTMLAATSDFYHLRTPVGHEFTQQRWKDAVRAADPGAQRTPTYSSFAADLAMGKVQKSAALDQLSVKYWVTSPLLAVGESQPVPAVEGDVRLGGGVAYCSLAGGPLRGVRLRIRQSMSASPQGTRPMIHVAVTSGGVKRGGSVLIDTDRDPGVLTVAVAGEDLPIDKPTIVRVWLTDTDGVRVFAGQDDRLACAPVRPVEDDLRLVHADAGGAIYERLRALPRIRWASVSKVVSDRAERVAQLRRGIPADTVLVEDSSLPTADGRDAAVTVLADDRERIEVRVEAKGTGYLVVADSIVRPGWRATVDGSYVDIQHGNHAFAAVPVSAGTHTVELRYTAPGLKAGLAVTVVSISLAAIPIFAPILRRRRRVLR